MKSALKSRLFWSFMSLVLSAIGFLVTWVIQSPILGAISGGLLFFGVVGIIIYGISNLV